MSLYKCDPGVTSLSFFFCYERAKLTVKSKFMVFIVFLFVYCYYYDKQLTIRLVIMKTAFFKYKYSIMKLRKYFAEHIISELYHKLDLALLC